MENEKEEVSSDVAYNLIISGVEWEIRSTLNGWKAYCYDDESEVTAPETFTAENFEFLLRVRYAAVNDGIKIGEWRAKHAIQKALGL